jgi:hypothetical protein
MTHDFFLIIAPKSMSVSRDKPLHQIMLLAADCWEGSTDWLSLRVGVGHNQLIPESLLHEWLLIERPPGESEPTKYWLSTLPANISFYRLVDLAKLRWRIERD